MDSLTCLNVCFLSYSKLHPVSPAILHSTKPPAVSTPSGPSSSQRKQEEDLVEEMDRLEVQELEAALSRDISRFDPLTQLSSQDSLLSLPSDAEQSQLSSLDLAMGSQGSQLPMRRSFSSDIGDELKEREPQRKPTPSNSGSLRGSLIHSLRNSLHVEPLKAPAGATAAASTTTRSVELRRRIANLAESRPPVW